MHRERLLIAMATNTTRYQEKENNERVPNSSPTLLSPVITYDEYAFHRKDNAAAKAQSKFSVPSSSTIHPVLQRIDVNSSSSMVNNGKSLSYCNQKKYDISRIHSDQSYFDDSD